RDAWRHAMFNQFHDILPGSGVRETFHYAQGRVQEILARTNAVRTRCLRGIAQAVDTASLAARGEAGPAQGLGAGVGEGAWWGEVSSLGAGAGDVHPFVVFNPSPWSRTDVVTVKVWDHELPDDRIVVRGSEGEATRGQVLQKGHYWGHHFITVAFPARDLPALGYRAYVVARSAGAAQAAEARASGDDVIENEFLRVRVEPASGAVVSLVDKQAGYDFVPDGARLGLLQLLTEAPHGMTAWEIGQVVRQLDFTDGGTLNVVHRGPNVAALRCVHTHNDSTFEMTVGLRAGVPRVDFTLNVNWLERGSPQLGVPMLKVAFPLAVEHGRATFEVPFGYVTRPTDGDEVPALTWADLSGAALGDAGPDQVGATLLNHSKYGHDVTADTIRLTLLRSSYDPDPLPELGQHEIKFALMPHVGQWSPSVATRAGSAFNPPLTAVGADLHDGRLPPTAQFVAVEPQNVVLSGLKKAEDSDAIVLRLYELEGVETKARVRLDKDIVAPDSPCVEADLLEQPLPESTAKMQGDTLAVTIPPYGIATVMVGC
ncbi:MAG: glycoside hydrolase family 38 C-terminal domain-containing protein, partial [Armatimonadota bacterium]